MFDYCKNHIMTLIMNTIEEKIISLYIIKMNSARPSFVCPSVWLKSFLIFMFFSRTTRSDLTKLSTNRIQVSSKYSKGRILQNSKKSLRKFRKSFFQNPCSNFNKSFMGYVMSSLLKQRAWTENSKTAKLHWGHLKYSSPEPLS